MPNRIIKESICTSPEIDQLTDRQENLFYRLLVNCDDFGLMEARSEIVISKCYPLRRKMKISTVRDALSKLESVGLIFRYENGGRIYLKMTAWEKHQQKRAKYSKFPQPDITCNQMISIASNCTREARDETTRIEKRESETCAPAKPEKINFAEFVTLTQLEHDKLCSEHGQAVTNACIKKLNNYKGASGKTYRSDYRAILSWVLDDVNAKQTKRNALDRIGGMIDEPIERGEAGIHGPRKLPASSK